MQIIPAIDLRGGRVVRLLRGNPGDEEVYGSDPARAAGDFAAAGAKRLHVVDLDGAFQGFSRNMESIRKIAAVDGLEVQVGGGVRSLKGARSLLEAGVDRVVLGTAAVEDPRLVREFLKELGPKRVLVAVDAREGQVAVRGWVESSGRDALEFALQMQELGVGEIVYTDIMRDGTLSGPNLKALEKMALNTRMNIIASGGISSLEDLMSLKALAPLGITGAIVGQALYRRKFSLAQALKAVSHEGGGC